MFSLIGFFASMAGYHTALLVAGQAATSSTLFDEMMDKIKSNTRALVLVLAGSIFYFGWSALFFAILCGSHIFTLLRIDYDDIFKNLRGSDL
jgi:small neutral amino acid transporter SnatA (MarC family)